jgi:hypothetical protein
MTDKGKKEFTELKRIFHKIGGDASISTAVSSAVDTGEALLNKRSKGSRDGGYSGGKASGRGKGIEAIIIEAWNTLKAENDKAPTAKRVIEWLRQWTSDDAFEPAGFDVFVDGESLKQSGGKKDREIKLSYIPKVLSEMKEKNKIR